MFSRLLRPHPRVLGVSVCASTRCFLAGLSSGFSCVATVATRLLCSRTTVPVVSFFPVLLMATAVAGDDNADDADAVQCCRFCSIFRAVIFHGWGLTIIARTSLGATKPAHSQILLH